MKSLRQAITVMVVFGVVLGCRPSGLVTPNTTDNPPAQAESQVQTKREIGQAAVPTALNLPVRGQVSFASRVVQATSNDVIAIATVNMVDPGNNNTVGTSTTDSSGNFALSPNAGFNPRAGVYYLLDAVKGLGTNSPGKPTVRLRTLITWDTGNGGWLSISNATSTVSGGVLSIRSLTTAVSLISAFDGAKVSAARTIGTVIDSGGWKLADSALGAAYPDAVVNALDGLINRYLANDLDPVGSITALTPAISGLDTPSGGEGDLLTVSGSGFSPIPADNALIFNTSQALAGAAVVNPVRATSTSLMFKLPSVPLKGAGFVSVVMNNQISNWQSFTMKAAASNTDALAITTISPGNGKPGDLVTIKGRGFDTEVKNDIVYLGGVRVTPTTAKEDELKVRVPDTAKSDSVFVQTPTGQSNKVYFAVFIDQSVAETFANQNNQDLAASTAVGWPGPVVNAMGQNDTGSGADGAKTIAAANTVVNTERTTLAGAASAGQNTLSVANGGIFAANQEVMIIVTKNPSNAGTVGNYEFATISSIAGNTLTLSSGVGQSYNTNVTQVFRVPHYTDLVVNGGASIIAPNWNGSTGGIVAFRASKSIVNNGTISANSSGYYTNYADQGGWQRTYPFMRWFGSGEGRTGNSGLYQSAANDMGGGGCFPGYGPRVGWAWPSSGGGGGHGTAGAAGGNAGCPRGICTDYGRGGSVGGTDNPTQLTFGGSGGSTIWGGGGSGGGIVFMSAPRITNAGGLQALGTTSNGGGGAGGEIYLRAAYLNTPGSFNAQGAAGYNGWGGGGGQGRHKLVYYILDRTVAQINQAPAIGHSAPYDSFANLSVAQSTAYDTGNVRPFYTGFTKSETLNGQTIAYTFSDSPDRVNWSAFTADITILNSRYIRWKATMITADTKMTPVLSGITVNYRVSQ